MKYLYSLLLIIFFTSFNLYAMDASSVDDQVLPNDFRSLADMRIKLNLEISYLEYEIQNLETSVAKLEPQKSNLEDLKKRIAELEKRKNAGKELDEVKYFARNTERDIKELEKNKSDLEKKKNELNEKKRLDRRLQDKIAKMTSPEQNFKMMMSGTFALLIGLVIIGFFVISYKDDKIRQAIFSGQAGIQFLTLFSLVIAIILFGITGILEGKELAALLGGLSGYILGRVTNNGNQPKDTPDIKEPK